MKVLSFLIFVFFLFTFSGKINGQQLKENEIVVIQGEKFVLHQVRTGETIYSITRDFKIKQGQLLENNPQVSEGLDIGEILKIPYREGAILQNIPVSQKGDPSGYLKHVIESKKETPYFIAKQYGITVEEIYAYNPELRRLKKGMEIRIPSWNESGNSEVNPKQESTEVVTGNSEKELQEHMVASGETLYSIAKKYGVSESEILFFNPEAKNLKAGSRIYLPLKKQESSSNEIVNAPESRSNSSYFEHTISSGETLWGITNKFKVSAEELVELNPVLKTAFPAGVVIKIPVNEIPETHVTASSDEAVNYVPAKEDETLYTLSEKYGLSVPEIKKFNPQLQGRNPVKGEMVLIPKTVKTEDKLVVENEPEVKSETEKPLNHFDLEVALEIPAECVPGRNNSFSREKYDVALFLPLFLEENEKLNREILPDTSSFLNPEFGNDTIIELEESKEKFKQFYGNSENFLQFYEGVLIAVDSLKWAGMNVKLHVYDTQNNVEVVRKSLNTDDFLETDLIIGPVYPNVQEIVARIAAKNQIPMISPFASRSDLVSQNPYFFQINPSRDYIDIKTAEMVAEEYYNSNFIILKTSDYTGTPEGSLVHLIQEKLFNTGYLNREDGVRFSVYDFKKEGASGLRRVLSAEKENVIYIPSSQEGELSISISNLNNLTDDYSITLIAPSNYQQRFPSIDVAQFHNLKMKYVYPFWMNYENPATIRFIEKFKNNFYTEPSNFGVQGFDAAFYFLNAMNFYGKNFEDCLPYFHMNLVQGNYHFEKVSQFGGFMNKGVSVIDYHRDYSVHRERVKGQPKLVAGN